MKNLLIIFCSFLLITSCEPPKEDKSATGVNKAKLTIPTDHEGHTVEQKNVMERLKIDNMPGSIKHLYLISPYSGQVILYSTVKGKVTSGSKRLTPSSVVENDMHNGMNVSINNEMYRTEEVLGDDGTYGSSSEYIYWFDIRGAYHQHFIESGIVIHISDQPISVKNIVINIEETVKK